MTMLQEQAIGMIKELPDEKVVVIVNMMKKFNSSKRNRKDGPSPALKFILENRVKAPADMDYKEEYRKAILEKYESVD